MRGGVVLLVREKQGTRDEGKGKKRADGRRYMKLQRRMDDGMATMKNTKRTTNEQYNTMQEGYRKITQEHR